MSWVSDLQDLRERIDKTSTGVDGAVRQVASRFPSQASDMLMIGASVKEILTQIERSIADIIIKNIE